MTPVKRIGLFGGTFNPIHFGHLRTMREVQEAFSLDHVYFIPSSIPPHKSSEGIATAQERFEMTRLAVSGYDDFIVSDIELTRSGPSYTIDTMRYFKSTCAADSILYLITGIDAFLEIDSWKSFRQLFTQIAFIVMYRPGNWYETANRKDSRLPVPVSQFNLLENFLKIRISKQYHFSEEQSGFIHPETQPVYPVQVTQMDISSTKIRKMIREGKTVQYLMPEKVEEYIQIKRLYK